MTLDMFFALKDKGIRPLFVDRDGAWMDCNGKVFCFPSDAESVDRKGEE